MMKYKVKEAKSKFILYYTLAILVAIICFVIVGNMNERKMVFAIILFAPHLLLVIIPIKLYQNRLEKNNIKFILMQSLMQSTIILIPIDIIYLYVSKMIYHNIVPADCLIIVYIHLLSLAYWHGINID